MTTVRVRFYGAVRTMTRLGQADFELPENATLGDLVPLLAGRFGPDLVQMLFDPEGRPHQFAKVFLDGDELEDGVWTVPLTQKANTPEVGLFVLSPVVGGKGADGPCC